MSVNFKIRVPQLVLAACFLGLAVTAGAQEIKSAQPLAFQGWKDQQVLEAQNQVLRTSARLNSIKSSRPLAIKTKDGVATKAKKTDADPVTSAELDLKRAKDSLETAQALKFEDYVDVYIPTLQDQPEALQKIAEKLSKEELMVVVKGLMRQPSPSDAKRSAALLEGLTLSEPAKTQ